MTSRAREKKRDPGSPAKEETPDQFIENRLVKLETGMTNLDSNLKSLEAAVSDMADRQSTTDTKLDKIIALMAGGQNTAEDGIAEVATKFFQVFTRVLHIPTSVALFNSILPALRGHKSQPLSTI